MTCPVCRKGSIRVMESAPPRGENMLFCDNPDCFTIFRGRGMRFRPPTLPTLEIEPKSVQAEAKRMSRKERQLLAGRSPTVERWLMG